jgi:two-component system, chemotaxis family, sensor kinase CheA
MDILTKAAMESLARDILPRLQARLESMLETTSPSDGPDNDLRFLIRENMELTMLLSRWQSGDASHDNGSENTPDGTEEFTDEDALHMLQEMGAPVILGELEAADEDPSLTLESSSDLPQDEMDDATARQLLAEMDSPIAAASDEMSEEEARMLLADMDSPVVEITAAETHSESPSAQSMQSSTEDDAIAEDLSSIPEWTNNEFASDPEMFKDFMLNCEELMANLDETVLRLEQEPDNREIIEEIFRAAHTLKGGAGMFGYRAIEKVMHAMENLFDLIRKGTLKADGAVTDVVLKGLDVLRVLIEAVRTQTKSGMDISEIVANIQAVASGRKLKTAGSAAAASSGKSAGRDAKDHAEQDTKEVREVKGEEHGETRKKAEQSTIRVDLSRLDVLVNLVGELVIDRTRFATIEENMRVSKIQSKMASHMTETTQLFGRHLLEIQDIIMKLRMVPIGNALNKFPRVVRDLAKSLGKEIDITIVGESTELDKTLVEQIGDPLVHLIRNACDHGIETPEDRKAAGKAVRGKITLAATQEGNHINIVISDDGKGMDPERIRKKAIEKGLIGEEENLTEQDIFNLIFEPGFSTAEKVTTVSGRGVGMDVVKKQISKLKGMVDIRSKVGKGSTIAIQLPLTLAIVESLLIRVREQVYALPLSSVVESIRIKPSDIQKVGDSEIIKLRDQVLPLMHLGDTLSLSAIGNNQWYRAIGPEESAPAGFSKLRQKDRLYVVVVGSAERRFGIVVDSLLNQQEMVIKSMGQVMAGVPCFSGGAVLGNGEVVLVLDVPELDRHYRSRLRSLQAA